MSRVAEVTKALLSSPPVKAGPQHLNGKWSRETWQDRIKDCGCSMRGLCCPNIYACKIESVKEEAWRALTESS